MKAMQRRSRCAPLGAATGPRLAPVAANEPAAPSQQHGPRDGSGPATTARARVRTLPTSRQLAMRPADPLAAAQKSTRSRCSVPRIQPSGALLTHATIVDLAAQASPQHAP